MLPIDVVLRRPSSERCDPLELAPESTEGVASSVQVARNGSVRSVNMLGSGLIESPVFMAFLPRLCAALLGEKSVYCADLGWIDFDPTNDVITNTDHITSTWGRDYSDVTSICGVFTGGGSHTLSFSVDVEHLE